MTTALSLHAFCRHSQPPPPAVFWKKYYRFCEWLVTQTQHGFRLFNAHQVHIMLNQTAGELSWKEDPAGSKQTPRRHVEALLDISEEISMKELEPYEHDDPLGWEHVVCGWTRVAPLSCLLMAQKNNRKPKHKEVETPTPLCVDSPGPKAEGSASTTEQPRESRAGSANCKKSVSASQQMDSLETTKWPAQNATQEDVAHLRFKEKTEERLLKITPLRPCHLSSQRSLPENRRTQKHRRKPTNKVLPVNNFTFSPPNQSPRENPKQNFFTFNRKSAARRTGVDTVAYSDLSVHSSAPTSKYHKPHFFSTASVPLLKKNQLQYLCLPHRTQRSPRATQQARASHSP